MAERGGRRQGTPGKGYSNRTDLNVVRAPQTGMATAAAGGQAPPTPAATPAAPPAMPVGPSPDQTPNLFDPGNAQLPLQDGLPSGPGAGVAAPGGSDIAIIQRYLPDLQAAAKMEGAPPSFVALVNFLRKA